MEILDLFIVALIPVLKTLLITAVGLLLALDRINILGEVARHHLNNLVFYVFIPALVGSSLADTITATSLVSLWFMPVNILLTFVIGSALGWILVKITRTPEHLHGLVIGCCAAGNLGNLLLIIIPAVCEESNSPFGDATTCSTNGQAYVSLSMAIGAVYIWSYVYNIIRAYGNVGDKEITMSSTISIDCSGKTLDIFTENYNEALLANHDSSSDDEECEVPPELNDVEQYQSYHSMDKIKVSTLMKIKQHVKIFVEKTNLKMWFTPSTIATIVGLLIGVISPVRKLMVGDSAPLRVIDSSADLLGEATIPAMTLIVGANLLKGLKRSEVGVWLIVGILVVRYVALPLVGVGIVKAAQYFGLVGSDSLYQFVLMLQYALPPAMGIGTITQLFEVGESECSVIMLWTYVVASLSLTLWSTFYMWLVS